MANLNDLPPITYVTERFAICEWAERVLVRTHGSQAEFLGFGFNAATDVINRLYNFAEKESAWSSPLRVAIDTFEGYVYHSDKNENGDITVPMEIAIHLAQRVMEHARH